ncbi:hypothetical protein AOLI_G00311810 [Acnodon oligacanthus]
MPLQHNSSYLAQGNGPGTNQENARKARISNKGVGNPPQNRAGLNAPTQFNISHLPAPTKCNVLPARILPLQLDAMPARTRLLWAEVLVCSLLRLAFVIPTTGVQCALTTPKIK